jgi:hypothetical protein
LNTALQILANLADLDQSASAASKPPRSRREAASKILQSTASHHQTIA